jgi:predicted Zn-dependent protease
MTKTTVARALAIAMTTLLIGACGKMTPSDAMSQLGNVAGDLKTAVTGIDEKDEIAIGREVAGRTLGAAPLVANRGMQSYVNRVGTWVALQSERPDLPWHFGVIDTPAVNSFAAPGGYILITRGLYQILENEAQLAGVLGHEVAHVVQRHHIRVMQQSAGFSAGSRLAQANTTSDRTGFAKNAIGTGAEIFARGLDKGAEFEADQIGVILAARAGYSPYGLIDMLHKLEKRSGSDASVALLFATHPPPAERLAKLSEALTPVVSKLPQGTTPRLRVR